MMVVDIHLRHTKLTLEKYGTDFFVLTMQDDGSSSGGKLNLFVSRGGVDTAIEMIKQLQKGLEFLSLEGERE